MILNRWLHAYVLGLESSGFIWLSRSVATQLAVILNKLPERKIGNLIIHWL